jgi:hypothetical protein
MHLTVIPSDKQIYLETPNANNNPTSWPLRRCLTINDPEFWASVPSDIHAIQYHSDGQKEIEYTLSSGKGNIPITDVSSLQKYIDRFNAAEPIYQAQVIWEKDCPEGETVPQKIARLGPYPRT